MCGLSALPVVVELELPEVGRVGEEAGGQGHQPVAGQVQGAQAAQPAQRPVMHLHKPVLMKAHIVTMKKWLDFKNTTLFAKEELLIPPAENK